MAEIKLDTHQTPEAKEKNHLINLIIVIIVAICLAIILAIFFCNKDIEKI